MKVGKTFEEQIAPNIALIKYWGKLEKYMNIPLNGSISLTLDKTQIYSKCKSKLEKKEDLETKENQFHLYDMDNQLIETKFHKKFPLIVNFFISEFCKDQKYTNEQAIKFKENFKDFVFKVEARNNFPSSAGLASSASGACALVLSISRIFNYFGESEAEYAANLSANIFSWLCNFESKKHEKIFKLCTLLRMVSGSSSRSLYPGLVFLSGIQNFGFEKELNGFLKNKDMRVSIYCEEMEKNANGKDYFFGVYERYFEYLKKNASISESFEKTPKGKITIYLK